MNKSQIKLTLIIRFFGGGRLHVFGYPKRRYGFTLRACCRPNKSFNKNTEMGQGIQTRQPWIQNLWKLNIDMEWYGSWTLSWRISRASPAVPGIQAIITVWTFRRQVAYWDPWKTYGMEGSSPISKFAKLQLALNLRMENQPEGCFMLGGYISQLVITSHRQSLLFDPVTNRINTSIYGWFLGDK